MLKKAEDRRQKVAEDRKNQKVCRKQNVAVGGM
jgi:hypothetical protein